MTSTTTDAVSTPAISRFDVGKSYGAKNTMLFNSQVTMKVTRRTKSLVTFLSDDEDDIRKGKVVNEYGVEKLRYHESNALDGDCEFSANGEVKTEISKS